MGDKSDEEVAQPAGDEAALKELAERLLRHVYGRQRHKGKLRPGLAEVRLVVGSIAEALPVELPVPEGSRVLGSVVAARRITVVIDVELPANEIIAFYKQKLAEAGWIQPEVGAPDEEGFSFVPDEGAMGATFCKGEQGPVLYVGATPGRGKPTDVRLELDANPEFSPCSPALRLFQRPAPKVLPKLAPPLDAEAFGGSSGSGGTHADSEIALVTRLDPSELHEHYSDQLVKSGWLLQGHEQNGLVTWSTWSFKSPDGEDWQAQLVVLQRPWSKRKYRVTVEAEPTGLDRWNEYPSGGHHKTSSHFEMYMKRGG